MSMFVVCWGSVAVGFVDWLVMVVRRLLGWLRRGLVVVVFVVGLPIVWGAVDGGFVAYCSVFW